jgi:hypothetical protein
MQRIARFYRYYYATPAARPQPVSAGAVVLRAAPAGVATRGRALLWCAILPMRPIWRRG